MSTSSRNENGLSVSIDAIETAVKGDAVELARYRALGQLLADIVAPQLDANVAKAVAEELDARDTDDVADADRERTRNAEINEAVEAAVTEAMGRLTDWLSPDDIIAVLNEKAYAKIAETLIDNAYITADVYHDVTVDLRANK
jgi:hypothetical protein